MWGMLCSSSRATAHSAQIVDRGGRGKMRKRVVVGMKGQRNEGLEAAGLVLQRAQAQQVIDPFFDASRRCRRA